MKWILYLIILLWIGGGTCFILYTEKSRAFMVKALSGIEIPLLSILPLTFGLLIIIYAYQSRAFWVVILLGILILGKGIFFLFNPKNLAGQVVAWFLQSMTDETYRLAGVILIIIGTALLSWI